MNIKPIEKEKENQKGKGKPANFVTFLSLFEILLYKNFIKTGFFISP